ncbi:MAG: DUF4197 domain-containing protein [Betaproteobacteria bacterium]
MSRFCFALLLALTCHFAHAGVADISNHDANAGLKEALTRGADFAVANLGKPDGFLGNPKVKIPLPDTLRKGEKALRAIGMGKQADELTLTMNRAAEQAVVEAKPILTDAIKKMTLQDAKAVLTGSDDAATQYFKRTTSAELNARFLPVIKRSTSKLQLTEKYNKFAGQAAGMGLMKKQDADLDSYVTRKAMDGLFLMIAEQEKNIRKDPVGAGSDLLKRVFGGLK